MSMGYALAELGEQACTWEPWAGRSPDPLDALDYALTDAASRQRRGG